MNAVTAPAYDATLDALIQPAISGITGIAGTNVRPRWQPTPPKKLPPTVDWCAFGITSIETAPLGAYIEQCLPSTAYPNGSSMYFRHEDIRVLVSFYGPDSSDNCGLLRDGFAIPQNVEGLLANSIAFVEAGHIRAVSYLVNQQWVRQYDIDLHFRRKVTRVYPVFGLTFANIHLFDDSGPNGAPVVDIAIQVPPQPAES